MLGRVPQNAAPGAGVKSAIYDCLVCVLYWEQIFCEVMYKAKTSKDLVAGIDEYAEDLTVLPASVWDPAIRIEPPQRPIKVVSNNATYAYLYPPSKLNETGGYTVFTFICLCVYLSVRTQSSLQQCIVHREMYSICV